MRQAARSAKARGFTLIELLTVVAIVGLLTAIAIPNLLSAQRRSRYTRAASDSKTAVTQAIVYGLDRNVYPTSIQALRSAGLASVTDTDPFGTPYQMSPALQAGESPASGGEAYVFSKGPYGTGIYPSPFSSNTGPGGSVGYSSVYGSWTGF